MLSKEDVVSVATGIKVSLTEEEIKEVLEMYPEAQENDPSGTWDLVIENCIHNVVADRPETKHVFYNITNRVGETEFQEKHVMEIPAESDLRKYGEEEFIPEYYGEPEEIDSSGFWYDSGCRVLWILELKEITKEEYKVLTKFI